MAQQDYPEGSLPSVPGPNAVPTHDRKGTDIIYAYGGWPTSSPGAWVIEAAQAAKERFVNAKAIVAGEIEATEKSD